MSPPRPIGARSSSLLWAGCCTLTLLALGAALLGELVSYVPGHEASGHLLTRALQPIGAALAWVVVGLLQSTRGRDARARQRGQIALWGGGAAALALATMAPWLGD